LNRDVQGGAVAAGTFKTSSRRGAAAASFSKSLRASGNRFFRKYWENA
jgi:hypothetical protein